MRPVARLGDQGVPHCSGFSIAKGSPTVFVNLKPAARLGDISTPHLKPGPGNPPCSIHAAPISNGSATVFVNGIPIARVGDALAGCTFVATGSPTVFAG
jgi:uncharacterized Zn-binding protein involved in type VI secretion